MKGKLTNRQILTIGMMLFATFFGAGNFIFPPFLGFQAGTSIVPALIGFLLGAVGLPLIGVVATAIFGGNALRIMNRVHPVFGGIFVATLFLVIGPLFAVPRTATVAFSMAVEPFLAENVWYIMLPFMLVYFLITFYLCLSSERLVDAVGKYMTPVLVVLVLSIIVAALINPVGGSVNPAEMFQANAMASGLIEGFQTMDAMGSFIVAGIVVGAVKQFGAKETGEITKSTIKAGVIAAILLAIIYSGLAFVGASAGTYVEAAEGATILTSVVQSIFGPLGLVLLGLAILLACLSTATALVGACSKYFYERFPQIAYKKWLILFCGVSFLISNVGLAMLLNITVPVLQILYPLIMILIVYTFFDKYIRHKRAIYVGGVATVLVVSVLAELHFLGVTGSALTFMEHLPMYEIRFAWVIPFVMMTAVMYFLPTGETTWCEEEEAA